MGQAQTENSNMRTLRSNRHYLRRQDSDSEQDDHMMLFEDEELEEEPDSQAQQTNHRYYSNDQGSRYQGEGFAIPEPPHLRDNREASGS